MGGLRGGVQGIQGMEEIMFSQYLVPNWDRV